MPKKLELTIPTPCHEDWDKMTQSEKGRYCVSCQKQVVDFTNMTESQLVAFFRKESTGSVCGRFMEDQLDRQMDIPKKRIPWVKYFFQFTLPLFLGSLKATAQGQVKKTETKVTYTTHKPEELTPIMEEPKEENKRYTRITLGMVAAFPDYYATIYKSSISGMIANEDEDAVPYASVTIKGTTIGTIADSNGYFSITGPSGKKPFTLVVTSVGYKPKEIVIDKKVRKAGSFPIQLETIELNEVTVVGYGRTIRCTYRVGGVTSIMGEVLDSVTVTSKKITNQEETPNNSSMKVYPNPLPSGTSINIKCDKMEENYYSFQVLTLSGQQVYNKEIWIDKEARVLNMPMPAVAPGMYMVVMTDKQGGKRFTEKVVIQ